MVMLYPLDREVLKQIAFRENGIDAFAGKGRKILPKEIAFYAKQSTKLLKGSKRQI